MRLIKYILFVIIYINVKSYTSEVFHASSQAAYSDVTVSSLNPSDYETAVSALTQDDIHLPVSRQDSMLTEIGDDDYDVSGSLQIRKLPVFRKYVDPMGLFEPNGERSSLVAFALLEKTEKNVDPTMQKGCLPSESLTRPKIVFASKKTQEDAQDEEFKRSYNNRYCSRSFHESVEDLMDKLFLVGVDNPELREKAKNAFNRLEIIDEGFQIHSSSPRVITRTINEFKTEYKELFEKYQIKLLKQPKKIYLSEKQAVE